MKNVCVLLVVASLALGNAEDDGNNKNNMGNFNFPDMTNIFKGFQATGLSLKAVSENMGKMIAGATENPDTQKVLKVLTSAPGMDSMMKAAGNMGGMVHKLTVEVQDIMNGDNSVKDMISNFVDPQQVTKMVKLFGKAGQSMNNMCKDETLGEISSGNVAEMLSKNEGIKDLLSTIGEIGETGAEMATSTSIQGIFDPSQIGKYMTTVQNLAGADSLMKNGKNMKSLAKTMLGEGKKMLKDLALDNEVVDTIKKISDMSGFSDLKKNINQMMGMMSGMGGLMSSMGNMGNLMNMMSMGSNADGNRGLGAMVGSMMGNMGGDSSNMQSMMQQMSNMAGSMGGQGSNGQNMMTQISNMAGRLMNNKANGGSTNGQWMMRRLTNTDQMEPSLLE